MITLKKLHTVMPEILENLFPEKARQHFKEHDRQLRNGVSLQQFQELRVKHKNDVAALFRQTIKPAILGQENLEILLQTDPTTAVLYYDRLIAAPEGVLRMFQNCDAINLPDSQYGWECFLESLFIASWEKI